MRGRKTGRGDGERKGEKDGKRERRRRRRRRRKRGYLEEKFLQKNKTKQDIANFASSCPSVFVYVRAFLSSPDIFTYKFPKQFYVGEAHRKANVSVQKPNSLGEP